MNTLYELQQAVGGQVHWPAAAARNPKTVRWGPVSIDSRQVEPGSVFWALHGPRHDGNDFAADALARGASGAVVDRPIEAPAGHWTLEVPDTLAALRQWAAWKRRRFSGVVIAVTGSVGKTTTRQMIHTILATRLAGSATPRNYNNHIGVPVSMSRIEPHHDYAVLELGASRRGEIAELAELAAPKIGAITHVGEAHLGGFGGRHGVAVAKAELLAALPPDGHAVLGDDPWLRRLAQGCKAPITWVGRGAECDLAATDVRCGRGVLSFRLRQCEFSIPVWGRHHLVSALVAIATGRIMGFDLEQMAAALGQFRSLPMRCEVTEIRGATVINDTYNASPTAMRAALELLRDFDAPGRRIFVCGDMAELGDEATLLHRQLGSQVVTLCGADLLIACGQHAREVVAGARGAGMPQAHAIPCRTPEETLPYLGQAILPGDVVLVKGSRVLAMERVVEAMGQYPRRHSA